MSAREGRTRESHKQRGVRRSPGATTRWCSLSSAPWSCALLLWRRVLLPRLVLPRGDMDADDEDEEDDDEDEDDRDGDDECDDDECDEEDIEGVEEDDEDEAEEQLEYGLSKASGVGVRW